MIVLIAGMPRSGSTFSFNVVREILEARGSVYQEASDDAAGVISRGADYDHVIIKSHNPNPLSVALGRAEAMRVIMTVRRIEDAMASWLDTFDAVPEQVGLQIMRDWLLAFGKLRSKALIVRFEQIDTHPWLAAWHIARAICPIISPMEVLRISNRLNKAVVKSHSESIARDDPGVTDLGFSFYDAKTFFHRRHIGTLHSQPAEDRLPPERISSIREALAPAIASSGLASKIA